MRARAALAVWFIAALLGCFFTNARAAEPSFPQLTGRVVDQAAILDAAAKARIESKREELETRTSTQLVVVTLSSLQGYDIADYGYRLGRAWGIGEKKLNNGALLIVAPKERKVRVEVGYGLEGTLTDAISRLIIDNAILPRFRAGDLPGGIERGVDDLIQVLSGDADDFKRRAGTPTTQSAQQNSGALVLVLIILAIWLFIFLRQARHPARNNVGWWIPTGGGSWTGGGGGFSNSGGGFSGGGGSFGGGGASGSW
jgi:uncharacterized protein